MKMFIDIVIVSNFKQENYHIVYHRGLREHIFTINWVFASINS